jgi:hypothetical protein
MSLYGMRKFEKIHSESDTAIEKKFKSFIAFWGSLGYLAREEMIKNNNRAINLSQLEQDIETMGSFYTNNKARAEFLEEDNINFTNKRTLCRTMYKNIKEEDFSGVLNQFLKPNSTENMIAIKLLTPNFNSVQGINRIDKLKKNHWMSFTGLHNTSLEEVSKNPLSYIPISSIGATNIYEILILELPLRFEYVPTYNYCDIDEIIINSNEILNNENKIKLRFINYF